MHLLTVLTVGRYKRAAYATNSSNVPGSLNKTRQIFKDQINSISKKFITTEPCLQIYNLLILTNIWLLLKRIIFVIFVCRTCTNSYILI